MSPAVRVDAVTPEIAAVFALLLAAIGVAGVVVPVLPGSLTVGAGLLVWALFGGSSWGWVTFGGGAVMLAVGATASWVLTGRSLRRREIPQWPVVVGVVAGIAGMFLLPALGFVVGFVVGVLASEVARLRDLRAAWETSWAMIKAVGIGMLVELGCAATASGILAISVFLRFVGGSS